MQIITRERAVCIFFDVEYTEENAAKYAKRIEDAENLEICYKENPKHPFLCSKRSMELYPSRYKTYPAIIH